MNEAEWHKRLGDLVQDYIRSPELEHYFSVKMTKPRAAIMVTQQSLYVRHRRECWSHVSANCPVLAIKQRILEHEYEEIIRDDFSEYGHLHLIIRQGQSVGLEAPLPLKAYIEGVAGLKSRKDFDYKVLGKYLLGAGDSLDEAYDYAVKYLDRNARIEPAVIQTVLNREGKKDTSVNEFSDNSIVDRIIKEGFVERLYK